MIYIVSQNLTHDVARFRYAPDRVGQCVEEPPLLWAQVVRKPFQFSEPEPDWSPPGSLSVKVGRICPVIVLRGSEAL